MIEPLKSAQIYLKVLCDVFGESLNGLVRKALEGFEFDRNSLAATIGALLGIYRNGRVPRRYGCVDFVKALGIEKDYDEEYVYGEPSLKARSFRELELIPMMEDLLREAQSALHKIAASRLEDPYLAIETFSENRYQDPRLEKFEVYFDSGRIIVKLCYRRREIYEALKKMRFGGINSGIVASAYAMIKGYKGAKFSELRDKGGCLEIVFEAL